jgi:hypothetical protein
MYKKEYKKTSIFMKKLHWDRRKKGAVYHWSRHHIVIGGECTSFRFRLRLVGVVLLLKNISHLEWIRRESRM